MRETKEQKIIRLENKVDELETSIKEIKKGNREYVRGLKSEIKGLTSQLEKQTSENGNFSSSVEKLQKNAGIINRNRNNSASCTDNKRITLKISEIREIAI